jgi:hypothetical protein
VLIDRRFKTGFIVAFALLWFALIFVPPVIATLR